MSGGEDTKLEPLAEGLVDAWLRSDQHNRTLLAAIDLTALLITPRPRARSIGKIFAHVVSVRLRRVEHIAGQEWLEEIEPLAAGDEESRDALDAALETSAALVERLARDRITSGEKVAGFSGGVPALLAFLIAHDAHHRGQILGLLAREKIDVGDEVGYGIWDWK